MTLLETKIERNITAGSYWTIIKHFEECAPENRKPYIEVHMNIDGLEVVDRWYAARIPYIMHCLRDQYNLTQEMSLADLLKIASTHGVGLTVSYDPQYGRQIDYRYLNGMFTVDRYPEES